MSDLEREISLLKRRKAILAARDDLIAFTKFMRPVPDDPDNLELSTYEAQRHHRAIAAALERVEAGSIKRLSITVPPRHGKTTLASHMFPAWYAGRNPENSFILSTYNEPFAHDFGRAVRSIMLDPLYAQIFPETVLEADDQAVNRLATTRGGALFFVSKGSALTGRGADCIVVDDPVKDRKSADSMALREQDWSWFTQVLMTRLMTKAGRVVLIASRWTEDDILGRLTDPVNPCYSFKEAKKWHLIDLPALARQDDVLGRRKGEALWPGRFDRDYLESQQALDQRGFQALYQGEPSPPEGVFFKADFLRTYRMVRDRPPDDELRFYAASDHAVSLEQGADLSALVVVGIDKNDTMWVMHDIVWERLATDKAVEAMLRLIKKYRPLFWWAEKGHISKSIGPFLRKRMLEERVYCPVIELTPTMDKLTRAQSIQARAAMGMLRFPSFTRWWPDAELQLKRFPHGPHDDLVDALSCLGLGLALQVPGKVKPKEDTGPKAWTLGWVKDQTRKAEAEGRKLSGRGGW